ncbi:uncharacterized protein N7459_000412 [Penicillium hispanicum]|uniref:uncharacterized protein n=1 Tax=Penicillium hispanicum TaxID=1080232 RepID=UPI0025417A08|nr:uncharacterized protein N7459_000412 [Penicillium hispanicum]KAJ5594204.1 hypothetical protein N7459_000412 [Penicillium hispanicum]
MDVANTSGYTQPAYCAYARDAFPSLPSPPAFYIEAPLSQAAHPHADATAILDACCETRVWLFANPEPCTAVCNATSAAQAQRVSYCLNAQEVNYGGDVGESAAVQRAPLARRLWAVMVASGLVVSGVMW